MTVPPGVEAKAFFASGLLVRRVKAPPDWSSPHPPLRSALSGSCRAGTAGPRVGRSGATGSSWSPCSCFGKVDRAAGLVWRYQNPENYYLVRANALESNVVLYKVEAGKRTDLDPVGSGLFAYGAKAPVASEKWSTLGVEVKGKRFSVSLDGRHLFDVEDETFEGPGKVGLWTKADSVTAFDHFEIDPLDGGAR